MTFLEKAKSGFDFGLFVSFCFITREKLYKQIVALVGAGRKKWRNFQELCEFPEKDTVR